ncbi:dTDP-4-dehydrorhamnose 3,5-epimerase [Marinitoga hydrogenitolerans DSM 16785]|uniref:dTDP-4-dehydrorhamnose 3,5-epimerase n=1 Tax=Marinitoga hydrogenitolerans (strain DSM 16785 / JCM 12826 / AT1271) TaxID=1122195 RepID=A0A1M4ZCH5_MARH1|nr:dTDP-4-dehydrorhamnose 3,5-epimerase [Marinitoga hydrogenitolerans]SHF15648.1 dTDP-4-dehydrorhamnose 3,5-epimerase [Marinitoga hydrogenitolerans DSM 16785]
MEIIKTKFEGIYLIKTNFFKDFRGVFNKVFNYNIFKKSGLNSEFKEFFYSISQKNVIRGMHFQVPPYEHEKLVFVSNGCIIDVVVDIRKNSENFGKFFAIRLCSEENLAIYISKGFAHGFLSLEDNTIVNYLTTSIYSKEHDFGIKWNSFRYNWSVKNPIVSERDNSFPELKEFDSPF